MKHISFGSFQIPTLISKKGKKGIKSTPCNKSKLLCYLAVCLKYNVLKFQQTWISYLSPEKRLKLTVHH